MPGFIGFKKDTVILPGYLIISFFGQTLPKFNVIGAHETLNVSYIYFYIF